MQAIIETCGKQYTVEKGAKLTVSRLSGEAGSEVKFDKVLMLRDKDTQVGQPYVSGASVTAKILRQQKAKKITVFKYKRRKGYHKKQGHRQDQTVVEIQDIVGA